ncbi:MAG: hypothetical protein AAFY60_19255, partial [Myxococcota bacterium]
RTQVHELPKVDEHSATAELRVAHPCDYETFAELAPLYTPYTFDGPEVPKDRGALIRPESGLEASRGTLVRREHLVAKDKNGHLTGAITAGLPHTMWQAPELHKIFPEYAPELRDVFEKGEFMFLGKLAVHPKALRAGVADALFDAAKARYKDTTGRPRPLLCQVILARPNELGQPIPDSLNFKCLELLNKQGFHFAGWTSTLTDHQGLSPDSYSAPHSGVDEKFVAGLFYLPADRRPPNQPDRDDYMARIYQHPWTESDRTRQLNKSRKWFPAHRPAGLPPLRSGELYERERNQLVLATGSPWNRFNARNIVMNRPQQKQSTVDTFERRT